LLNAVSIKLLKKGLDPVTSSETPSQA